jgi:predicted ester cyclase
MSERENKDLVRRYFDERWNKQNYAVVDELLPAAAAEEQKASMSRIHATVSEMQLSIGDTVAEGELVALHWSVRCVLSQAVTGVGSTGDQISYSGLAMLRVKDGKIVDDQAYSDEVGTPLFAV